MSRFGRAPFTARLDATDDLAGINYCFVRFTSPSGKQTREEFCASQNGTPLSGRYELVLDMLPWSESGAWRATVGLGDAAANFSRYTADQVDTTGSGRLHVASVPDLTPPDVIRLLFDPAVIDVTAGPQQLITLINFVDSQSGPNIVNAPWYFHPPAWSVVLESPSGRQEQYIARRDAATYAIKPGGTPRSKPDLTRHIRQP